MKKLILTIAILPLLVCSCVKELTDKIDEIDENSIKFNVGAPLVTGNFSIDDFSDKLTQEDLEIEYADDGTIILMYKQPSVFSQAAEDVFSIPDQTFNKYISAAGDVPATGISRTITTTEEIAFDLNSPDGDKLYEILLKSGLMNIDLTGNIPVTGQIDVTFHSVIKNGNPVTSTYTWTTLGAQDYSENVSLNDASINLRSSGTTETNKFKITIETTINYDGSAMSSTQGFQLNIGLSNMKFSKLLATFAQRNIMSETETFKLEFSEDTFKYELVDTKFHFNIKNSIGAPMEIQFGDIVTFAANRTHNFLTGTIFNSPITIQHANTPGEIKTTKIEINNNNSNISDLLNSQPDNILYSLIGKVNPNNLDDEHFVLDTSKLVADVFLELPLYGAIKNIVIKEKYDFKGEDLEKVDNTKLKLTTENGIPLDAFVQGYFTNENDDTLDVLIDDDMHLIPAANTDDQGNVTSTSSKSVIIKLNEEKIEKLHDAILLKLDLTLKTPDALDKKIRFKKDDQLKINIFGQTEVGTDF